MSVLILGATSPIARETALCYAESGHDIAVAARDVEEAGRIASDLELRHGVRAHGFAFDARDFEDHREFVEQVEDTLGPIQIALVAFGDMGEQELSESDFDEARRVIEVNYTGAVSISEAVAAKMIERGDGSIIGISSVAGDRGRASNYFYGSAKGAFALYLGGLRNRCAEHGVHVLTVKLGFVDTRMTFDIETAIPVAAPEDAAEAIVKAQRRRAEILYYPRFWRSIMGAIKAIPEGIFKKMKL